MILFYVKCTQERVGIFLLWNRKKSINSTCRMNWESVEKYVMKAFDRNLHNPFVMKSKGSCNQRESIIAFKYSQSVNREHEDNPATDAGNL